MHGTDLYSYGVDTAITTVLKPYDAKCIQTKPYKFRHSGRQRELISPVLLVRT